jgi:hypothetical protein
MKTNIMGRINVTRCVRLGYFWPFQTIWRSHYSQ